MPIRNVNEENVLQVIVVGRHKFNAPEGVVIVKQVDVDYGLTPLDALAQFAKIARQAQELDADILLQNIPAQLGFAISVLDFWSNVVSVYATINAQRAAEGEKPTFYLSSIYNVRTGKTVWTPETGIADINDEYFSSDEFFEAINKYRSE